MESERERVYFRGREGVLEHYRRERVGWGEDSMFVYVHEFFSTQYALDVLFGNGMTTLRR
jgi:hypothetical protein